MFFIFFEFFHQFFFGLFLLSYKEIYDYGRDRDRRKSDKKIRPVVFKEAVVLISVTARNYKIIAGL